MSNHRQPLRFPCGNLSLEGCLHSPTGTPLAAALIAHPHPAYGGDMENNVVLALSSHLAANGFLAMRFNFRGVGGSDGVGKSGKVETEDVAAALAYLREQYPALPMIACGYSFGAWVMLRAVAQRRDLAGVVAVSPPVSLFSHQAIRALEVPAIFLSGSRDLFAQTLLLRRVLHAAGRDEELMLFSGVDHFWSGHEAMLAEAVLDFCRRLVETA